MLIDQTSKEDIWNPLFYKEFPGYSSILPLWQSVAHRFQTAFPRIEDFNAMGQNSLHFILQQKNMSYEREISNTRTIPSRENNWHDFFNNLSWMMWPKLKWAIIQSAYDPQKQSTNRTKRQSLLAHLDECGLIFCSDREEIFEDVRKFRWKKLFWETKALTQHAFPLLIGHGLLQKALTPFIGMTAKAILLKVPSRFFLLSDIEKSHYIDGEIANYILSDFFPHHPQALAPFPFLGWPGWHPDNQNEVFYDNTYYFRAGRSVHLQSVALAEYEGKNL